MKVESGVELARFTTLGTGGRARAFARPESLDDLQEVMCWAATERLEVAVVGLGSNLLVADSGVDALVLKLAGDLAGAVVDGRLLRAGGGASLAVCLHRARAAALGGLEFACAIPGTIGGGVRMNGGAYGGDMAGVVERALVVGAEGPAWRARDELGFAYRRSGIRPGEVVAAAELALTPRPVDEIKATVADMQVRRKAAQPTNKRTFGSVFANPGGQDLSAGRILEACGLRGYRIGGALISPRHANFIENAGGATSADALALMAEARRRALERFGIELRREVQFLGPLELPPAGEIISTAAR
jgi:UDP-N-acetylmuramate dehydrogenase